MSDDVEIPEPDVSEEHPISENWVWVGAHRPPSPRVLFDHMTTNWAVAEISTDVHPGVSYSAARRLRLAERFPDKTIVVPTGNFKVRANDTDYPFRAGTDFFYLTACEEPDAVLVISPGESHAPRSTFPTVATPPRTSTTPTRVTASCGSVRGAAFSRRPSTSTSRPRHSRHLEKDLVALGGLGVMTLRGFDEASTPCTKSPNSTTNWPSP